MLRHPLRAASYLAILLVAPSALLAQSQPAAVPVSVTISVTDQRGAVIPEATVKVLNEKGDLAASLNTDHSGTVVAALAPGEYEMSAVAESFEGQTKKISIRATEGRDQKINFDLNGGRTGPAASPSTSPNDKPGYTAPPKPTDTTPPVRHDP
jgi:Carboxypeptidase regulatory-like domain